MAVAAGAGSKSYDYSKPGVWAQAVLDGIGAPSDPSSEAGARNIAFLEAWKKAEGTSARYNPLATTLVVGGSTTLAGNGPGVQEYAKPADGVAATVRTLLAGYPHVLGALRAGDPAGAVQSSGGIADLNRWVSGKSSPSPSTYTDNISSAFFSLLGQGASAYSGFGVGNFPVGHTTPADAAAAAAKAVANATGISALGSIASSFASAVGVLLNVNTWRRVGLAALGIILMLGGGYVLAKGAGMAPSVVPIPV